MAFALTGGPASAARPATGGPYDPAKYYVIVLQNVEENIYVGQLSALDGQYTCSFEDGGLCASQGGHDVLVQPDVKEGPFDTCAEALADYASISNTPHPAFGGTRIYIFGGSYFIDNQDRWCTASAAAGAALKSALAIGSVALDGSGLSAASSPYRAAGEHKLTVAVTGSNGGKPVAAADLSPVTVTASFDHTHYLGSAQTDASGVATFEVSFPDLPAGPGRHLLTIGARKAGYASASTRLTVVLDNGAAATEILTGPIPGTHVQGDLVTVTGRVVSLSFGDLLSTPVPSNVTLSGSTGKVSVPTKPDGSFSIQFAVGGPHERDSTVNLVTLVAVPLDRAAYRDASTFVPVELQLRGTLQITAATDQALYAQNAPVTVSGVVTADGKPVAASIIVALDGKAVGKISSSSDGTYSYTFTPTAGLSNATAALPGPHAFWLLPSVPGYVDGGGAGALFTVQDASTTCVPGAAGVSGVAGSATAESPGIATTKFTGPGAVVANGSRLVAGNTITAAAGAQLKLHFPFGGGASVDVAVNGGTKVGIATYCADASGKVSLRLVVDKPGQVLVSVANPGSNPTPLDFTLVTPTVQVASLHTEYLVTVDPSGATAVATIRGAAEVSSPSGGSGVEVGGGSAIDVQPGRKPSSGGVAAATGELEPALVATLAAASPAAPPPAQTGTAIDLTGTWKSPSDSDPLDEWHLQASGSGNSTLTATWGSGAPGHTDLHGTANATLGTSSGAAEQYVGTLTITEGDDVYRGTISFTVVDADHFTLTYRETTLNGSAFAGQSSTVTMVRVT